MPTPYQFSVYVSSNKGMYFTSSTPAAAPEGLLAIRFRCQQLPKKTKCSRRPARPGLSRPSLPRLEPSPTAPPAPRPSSPCSPRSSFPVTGLPTLRALVSPASSARAACNRGIDLFNDSVHRRFITAGVIDGFDIDCRTAGRRPSASGDALLGKVSGLQLGTTDRASPLVKTHSVIGCISLFQRFLLNLSGEQRSCAVGFGSW
jgi:hypothetical protein